MGIGDWGLGIGDWGLGGVSKSQAVILIDLYPIQNNIIYLIK